MDQDTDNQNDQGVPDLSNAPAVDQELAERVVKLYQEVDETLEELRVPDDERKEIEQNLMEAIAADPLVRLGEKLSDEEKKDLAEMGEQAGGRRQ